MSGDDVTAKSIESIEEQNTTRQLRSIYEYETIFKDDSVEYLIHLKLANGDKIQIQRFIVTNIGEYNK